MVANINFKRDSTGAFYHSCGTLLEGQISFFSSVGPPAAAREAFKALASTVLEVENSTSEFLLQIKILLYKLMLHRTDWPRRIHKGNNETNNQYPL